MKTLIGTRLPVTLAILFLGLAATPFATAADLNVPADYPTIQAAVDAAVTNDTIHIAPGLYLGQVVVVRKKLNLVGAPGAVLRATLGMPASLEPYDFCTVPLLGVALSEVTIKGIALEGDHLAEGYPCRVAGIVFSGSSGTIENCSFSGFGQLGEFAGTGISIANNTTLGTGAVAVQILRCTFQDNVQSIILKGADATGSRLLPRLSFIVEGNTITGVGSTTKGTQQGIWIASGATGEVRYNTITDHAYTGSGLDFSHGIFAGDWLWLIFGQTPPAALLPVVYRGNVFRNNQIHLGTLYDNGSQIINNTFAATGPGHRPLGIAVSGRNLLIATNTFSDMPGGITLLGDDPDFPNGAIGIARNVQLIANRFCNVAEPIIIEPLTTNITQQGTLTCPFPSPALAIAPAVLLSWPGEDDGWTVESAPSVDGPWAASDATPFTQYGRHSIAVPTDSEPRFFRLH